jgi:nitrate ABC transporter ATP-binding subunit
LSKQIGGGLQDLSKQSSLSQVNEWLGMTINTIDRKIKMNNFVEVEQVGKTFNLSNGGSYIALKGIDLNMHKGEFISLIGHSGCGKSTLLNIIAGLDGATDGVVLVDDTPVTKPGPDRMVVFQNYSLLPWLTVRENIAMAVNKVLLGLPKTEREQIIEESVDMVGLRAAIDKKPGQLSGGMKQRVSIARAFAIRPKVLLLDEPFGALDALTRGGLQERLMQICEENHVTAVMVTHDIDEALLLSDRIIMLTNAPESKIGQILDVDIPRPRKRLEVVEHPSYYSLRSEMIYFLNQLRYWLAAGGIDPDNDVNLMTIPPAQMVVDLKAGTIDGYCVGEPWNYRAASEEKGFTIASDLGIWNGHPGKVLGVKEDWANAYPNTHIALVKALLEACQYCANPQNVNEIRHLLSQKEYLGMKIDYITLADPSNDIGTHDPHQEYAHPQFFGTGLNRPSRTEQLWIITQMARWGITPFPRNWVEILERVCRISSFSTASRELGLDIDYTRNAIELFDGVKFNAEDPIGYLNDLKIKRPISIAEVILDRR